MVLDELAQEEVVESLTEKKIAVFSPAQFNLFTGAAELIPIEVPEPAENEREIRVDEGISLVKSEDGSQLIFSGFGLFLSKKSERLIARKGKDVIYQFPLFRIQEVLSVPKELRFRRIYCRSFACGAFA